MNKIIILLVLICIFLIFFYRKPVRHNINNHLIVSPCDGKVMNVHKNKISVFLSIHNVHWQYVPIDGIVKNIEIIDGGYYMAMSPKSIHNKGVKITFNTKIGDVIVIQKVGFFVRRIINNIKVGDKVSQSEPYGLICFGSRVDIILPEGYNSSLSKNQNVIAGVTSLI